jgi:cation:H+ antiporter
MLILPVLMVLGGLAMLIIGAELLVRGAARLAQAAGISSFIVGLTVVAFGTSAPELAGSIRAAVEGNGGIAIGNVVGSNIANICLILGAAAVICPIPVRINTIRREVAVVILTSVAAIVSMLGGQTHRVAGAALVAGLVVFTVRAYVAGRRAGPDQAPLMASAAKELEEELAPARRLSPALCVVLVLVGLTMLFFGSGWVVAGSVVIAEALGVSDAVIGLSLVAIGTSVPELSLSVIAAVRKQPDIAVGNVLGSNIFNVLCVLGVSALVSPHPLPVPPEIMARDVWVMLGVSVACLPILGPGRRVSRWEGALLLGLYGAYLGAVFLLGGPTAAAG